LADTTRSRIERAGTAQPWQSVGLGTEAASHGWSLTVRAGFGVRKSWDR
jgi:hypothetical protein